MHKVRFAEWLLRSVTSPERVVSTAGDLMESAPVRGAFWFWSSVLQTVGSQMWRGLAGSPRAMIILASRASLQSILYAVFVVPIFVMAAVGRHRITRRPAGIGPLEALLSQMLIQFLVGRWIGRHAPEKRLSAVLALCIMQSAMGLCVGAVQQILWHSFSWAKTLLPLAMAIISSLPLFPGALSVTRLAPRRAIR